MTSKDKLVIIGTVPIAMIINLCLLNYFFGNKQEYKKPVTSHSEKIMNSKNNTAVQSESSIKFANTRNKLNIAHFPEPPIHTYAGVDSKDMAEDDETIKTKGAIIK